MLYIVLGKVSGDSRSCCGESISVSLTLTFKMLGGCQVPTVADWARDYIPRLLRIVREWQRTQTQSSVTALRARDSKWMSGSAGAGTTSREHGCAMKHPDQIHRALSRARPEASCFSLDFDLHGCPLIGQMRFRSDNCPRSRFYGNLDAGDR
jgi:hypothetical protein